jgi:UDP-glucose 4-epimerase
MVPHPMRVLVTGGAGFVGSHLCELLLERGAHVVALDDLSTGRLANLRAILDHPRFAFERLGLAAPGLAALVSRAERIFHLGAVVGVRRVLADPRATWRTNVEGTRALLAAAAAARVPCLFASSSEVYGARRDVPFRETDRPLQGTSSDPRWVYARSKLLGEELVRELLGAAGVPGVVARLFNVVGPRQSAEHGMVLPSFVEQAVSGQPITIFGSGAQTRAFLHVRDAVEALLGLAETAAGFEVVNVGRAEETSIGELAELVRDVTGSRSEIRRIDPALAYGRPVDELPRRAPDLARLRARFPFAPRFSLADAIRGLARERAPAVLAG